MKTVLATHDYLGDGLPDSVGDDRCQVCHTPKQNARHKVPGVPAAVAEVEARKLGEVNR